MTNELIGKILDAETKPLPAVKPVDDTTFETKLPDVVNIRIGDTRKKDFCPEIEIQKPHWKHGKYRLSLHHDLFGGDFVQVGDEIQYNKGSMTAKFRPEPAPFKSTLWQPLFEPVGGGFNFDIDLAKKPASNRIELFIETDGNLTFTEQLPLTKEDIQAGFYRHKNVEYSVAVYHATKQHRKYLTGKHSHIFTPYIVDSSDHGVWGQLRVQNNKITLIIPEQFYQKALYPIHIDPTFGYSACGATPLNVAGRIHGVEATISEHAVGNHVGGYFLSDHASENRHAQCNITNDDASAYIANGQTEENTSVNSPTPTTFDFLNPPLFVSGTTYIITAWHQYSSQKNAYANSMYDDVDGLGWWGAQDSGYPFSWPTPPGLNNTTHPNKRWSYWVDYRTVVGLLSAEFSEKAPGIAFTEKAPSIAMAERRPDITFSVN